MWKFRDRCRFRQKKSCFFFAFFLLSFIVTLSQQQVPVTGSVLSGIDNTPLAGVSVQVKGTAQGTTTNESGNYSVTAQRTSVLVFSRVGFTEQEIIVGNQTSVNVTLVSSNQDMEQVVVVGYGQQKKASVVAAISTIRTKDIKQSPSANLSVTLAGRLPGLTSIQRTGEPGRDAIELFIRGRSTINEQRPLLMVWKGSLTLLIQMR